MIKVLIVDDQELFRESLKVVLSVSENIRVTDAVSGVSQALKSAEQERPDVVLMDIRMPGMIPDMFINSATGSSIGFLPEPTP